MMANEFRGSLVLAVAAASLGMFTFGYNVGVANAPQAVIEQFYNESYFKREGRYMPEGMLTILWAVTISIYAFGGMIGGFLAGWWVDKFGRKRGMMINTFSGMIGALFMGFAGLATSYEMVIIGRFVIGFTCGIYTGVTPMYNAEIAPTNLRGAIGSVNQLAATSGQLISQILGLNKILGSKTLWPVVLALTGVPVVLQLVLLKMCPETPRYLLLIKGDNQAARKALLWLRGPDEELVEQELEQYHKETEANKSEEKMTLCQVLKTKSLHAPLFLAIVIQVSQQLTGMNIIFFYSTSLFETAGLTYEMAQYASLAVGGIMVVMTIVSIPLMDDAGRRTLHLSGLLGMLIFSIVFTISFNQSENTEWLKYLTIASALIMLVFFGVGPGPIPWMIVAELFSQGPRPGAMSIAVLFNWLSTFTIGLVFLPLQGVLGDLVFIPFTVLMALCLVFLYFKLPETKNKTFDEIAAFFGQPSKTDDSAAMLPKEPDTAL